MVFKGNHDNRISGLTGERLPFLLLLAAGMMEFLLIVVERKLYYLGYYLAETYLVVPCLLFLGYVLRGSLSAFAGKRLLLAAAAVAWFMIAQLFHKISGMESHPMATVFFVYLMGFPFAALTEDRENTGIRLMGRLLLAASLVLVGYAVILLLDLVPQSLRDNIFWDGARLTVLWHPNVAASYFMIGIGFAAAFYLQAKKPVVKILLILAILGQLLAMALTNCRTTLLLTGMLLVGILFLQIFDKIRAKYSWKMNKKWKQILLLAMILLLIVVICFLMAGKLYRWNNDRLAGGTDEILQGDNMQGSLLEDLSTLNGRTGIWKSALTAIRNDKKLALWGTEYVGTMISIYNSFSVVHSHNSWIEALMRMGLPGLLISLVFTAVAVWSAVRLILDQNTELWKKVIALTTVCIMGAGFLEPYLFITNVYYHVTDFVFFFFTGYLDYWSSSLPSNKKEI